MKEAEVSLGNHRGCQCRRIRLGLAVPQTRTAHRSILNGLKLDLYLPGPNVGIEINGPTHYLPVHGAMALLEQQARDLRKQELALELGLHLVTIDISKTHSFKELAKLIAYELIEFERVVTTRTNRDPL